MTAPASQTQWFLARDGQQYGPLSEAELAKFIELGHLQPNDLLWREGFPDWRPAMVVFPQKPGAPARPARRPPPDYGRDPDPAYSTGAAAKTGSKARTATRAVEAPRERGPMREPGRIRRAIVAIILAGALAASVWIAYPYRDRLMSFVSSLASGGLADRKSLGTPPFSGFKGNAEAIDGAMQATALWRVLKREFPDWYEARVKEVAALSAENKDDTTIARHLARSLVALRRQQVDNALSAPIPRLKVVAASFLENIVQLRKGGTQACYAFISQGESSPVVLGLLQGSEHVARLQSQMVGIIEAIAEGRKTPRVYPSPRQSDYDLLAADLTKIGWTKADLQLFSDEKALARAEPEKVCQLVHDWFAAQLAITDADAQQRLLVDSLRPVVAG